MSAFLILLGTPVLFAVVLILSAVIGLWNAWWAAKIWAMIVVPTTGWPALSWLAVFGVALTLAILRHSPRKSDEKYDTASWVGFVLAAPLTWCVAWIVARVLL